jgi:hypothetical protein
VRTIGHFPDPRLDALESAATLCAAETPEQLHRTLVDQMRADFLADWSALMIDSCVLASAGEMADDPSKLAALAAGTSASPRVADGITGPDDLAVASLVDHRASLLLGREGHPFRRRERAQLVALAGIADRTWSLLD